MIDERHFPHKQVSFTHAIAKTKKLPVFLLQGNNSQGDSCWCYLEVDANKDNALKHAAQSGDVFTLTDYGRIITSGIGDAPPHNMVEFLREEKIID